MENNSTPNDYRVNKQLQMMRFNGERWEMFGPILEDAGLERTIDWYLSAIERQLGLAVRYERPATPVAVDSEIGIQVYRVLQESLNNIAKHAGVKQAIVRLGVSNGMLQLEVEDHGSGIAASPSRRGLGIIGRRGRAALVGGTTECLRPDGGGTLVRLCVPMVGAHV